ncbi:PadR family transcriptional regulator [Sphingomonas sp. KR1UV-12]|uniref:PadR family transcriptional regulator n=1 Tax=Sphingomonas aurea TaxID=3063994 RepID=A0ABT9EK96_9SPHN|nr:PadR family transcriptional regulator [Sphingomonas sp. KR1UV-12]MDP1027351.1 PadR family transcriptional regulator [Sphingomonas sp. KR1UV-12]
MDVESWQSQLRKGAAELVVLAALDRQRAYGLQLLATINAGGELVTEGGLYPLLARLEKAGRIAAEWVLPEAGGNPRKYYVLTDEGRQLLAAMRGRWAAFRQTIDQLVEE